jgi:hypothetical protein
MATHKPFRIGTILKEPRLANAVGALKDQGVETLHDLSRFSDEELIAIKGIGPVLVARLREAERAVPESGSFPPKIIGGRDTVTHADGHAYEGLVLAQDEMGRINVRIPMKSGTEFVLNSLPYKPDGKPWGWANPEEKLPL